MKKTISSFLLSIFVLGAIPLTSSSCCAHEQLKIVKNDLSNSKHYLDPETFTADYSIVSALKQNGKISKQKAKKLMDSIVNNDYIETRVSDIVDKTAAEINTFGKLNN
ncbi:MAG: hypothetical protein K2L48_03835 [Mycoplasmoidaceae bacterium]|nr:hypothetical protein [Mycoplasmoidaceae bacterium]